MHTENRTTTNHLYRIQDAGADPSTVSRLERPGGMRVDVVHFFYASSHFLVSFLSGVAAFDPLLCENTHLQRLMVKVCKLGV